MGKLPLKDGSLSFGHTDVQMKEVSKPMDARRASRGRGLFPAQWRKR